MTFYVYRCNSFIVDLRLHRFVRCSPKLYEKIPASFPCCRPWFRQTAHIFIHRKGYHTHCRGNKNAYYYKAINTEWLKIVDISRVTSLQTSLDIGTLTRYCTLTRMPSHVIVTWRYFRWRQTSVTSREKVSPKNAKSEICTIKSRF